MRPTHTRLHVRPPGRPFSIQDFTLARMWTMRSVFVVMRSVFVVVLLFTGCGSKSAGTNGDGGPNGDATGDGNNTDPPAGCDPLGAQCNNCIDDDGDGHVDGADPECTGSDDNREDSFATGQPGDNVDPVLQDCFFDGNSGEGDDGCFRPTCCLTEGPGNGCPPPGPPPNDCTVSQQCIDFCAPLTPPGCDCFGCCTVCDDTSCVDVATGLASSSCTAETLQDTTACPRCVKSTDCNSECDPANCILCPGQTEDDLPDSCQGQACPEGTSACDANGNCGANQYCSNGCCIQILL